MNELTTTTELQATTPIPPTNQFTDERILTAVRAIQEKKGLDITVLDLSAISSFTDYFVLCSGTSDRHVKAIADEIEKKLYEIKAKPHHIEGYEDGQWVLFDCGDFIIHAFTQMTRQFYDLERLWRDAKKYSFNDPV
ncbi:MAG: ribosome silencing factor [Blastocatellia bacterium]|nr:ribosome silencing factor [Blastocatellia bacterium]